MIVVVNAPGSCGSGVGVDVAIVVLHQRVVQVVALVVVVVLTTAGEAGGAAQQVSDLRPRPPGGEVDAEDPDEPDEGAGQQEDDDLVDEGERLGAARVRRVDDGELHHGEDDDEDEGDEEGDDEAGHRGFGQEEVAAEEEGLLLRRRPVRSVAVGRGDHGGHGQGVAGAVDVGGATATDAHRSVGAASSQVRVGASEHSSSSGSSHSSCSSSSPSRSLRSEVEHPLLLGHGGDVTRSKTSGSLRRRRRILHVLPGNRVVGIVQLSVVVEVGGVQAVGPADAERVLRRRKWSTETTSTSN